MKLNEDGIKGIDSFNLTEAKTRNVRVILDALKASGKTLVIIEKQNDGLHRASSNLQKVTIRTLRDFSTMDVLRCDTMIMDKPALEKLHERCV